MSCEICNGSSIYTITIQKIMINTNGQQSQHVPFGQFWKFEICQRCLPFAVQTSVVEVKEVVETRKVLKTLEPEGERK